MEIEYMFICDHACADQNRKPCLIGIFDHINAPSFPFTQIAMSVAVAISGSAGEHFTVTVTLERPNGDVLAEAPTASHAFDRTGRECLAFQFGNVQFVDAGRYVFKASSGSGKGPAMSRSLQVQKRAPATSPVAVMH
jgi:hypothetical protein